MPKDNNDVNTFLGRPDLWPQDRSGKSVFLVKAVQEIARQFKVSDLKLPPCLYQYNYQLGAFHDASEIDKLRATKVINTNTTGCLIPIEDVHFYDEKNETGAHFARSSITEVQWEEAKEIIDLSKGSTDAIVAPAVTIASAIFEGVATGDINAYGRKEGPISYSQFDPDELNIDRFDAVRARLARGQVNRHNVFEHDPIGYESIFLGKESFQKWLNRKSRNTVKIELAKLWLVREAAKTDNVLSEDQSRIRLLSSKMYGFHLSDVDKDEVWNRLPDFPFKQAGPRTKVTKKGAADH